MVDTQPQLLAPEVIFVFLVIKKIPYRDIILPAELRDASLGGEKYINTLIHFGVIFFKHIIKLSQINNEAML